MKITKLYPFVKLKVDTWLYSYSHLFSRLESIHTIWKINHISIITFHLILFLSVSYSRKQRTSFIHVLLVLNQEGVFRGRILVVAKKNTRGQHTLIDDNDYLKHSVFFLY